MYKLLAMDMDGTLLREDKTISKRTLNAIQKAKEKGVKIVLSTGRPLEGVKKYLNELDLLSDNDYAVVFNGASVVNTSSGKSIYSSSLKGSDFKYLFRLGQKLGVSLHAYDGDKCVTPSEISKYTKLEGDINGIPVYQIDINSISDDQEIIKVLMVEDKPKLDIAFSNLPKEVFENYTVVRSSPYFLEFLNKTTNKGTGVQKLAEELNINPKEIICIGDAGNDIHMIKYAGLGVAMGNAFKEVKESADFITETNENHGVAKIIEDFILAG